MNSATNETERGNGIGREGTVPGQPMNREKNADGEGSGLERTDGRTDVWTMSALAHTSILLTVALSPAGGVGALVGLVIPLVIYLSYRDRSRFVAFHGMQALVYQGAGILIYLIVAVLLALVVTAAWTISGLLSAVAVGFLLMPLAVLITVGMVVVLLIAPVAWMIYGLYAAYQVYQGNDFRYWLLGEWAEREMKL